MSVKKPEQNTIKFAVVVPGRCLDILRVSTPCLLVK